MKNTLKTPLKYLTNDHAEGCMANLQTLKRERNFLKEDGTEDKDAKKRFAKSLNEFPNVHLGITTAQPGVGPDTAHLGRVLEAADVSELYER